jgi:hypothetical protein
MSTIYRARKTVPALVTLLLLAGCCSFLSRSGGVKQLVQQDQEYLAMLESTPAPLAPAYTPTVTGLAPVALKSRSKTANINGEHRRRTPSADAAKSPLPTATPYEFAFLLNQPTPVLGRPFAPGEKLTFNISFMGMVLGKASWLVGPMEYVDGHYCYYLIGKARTSYLLRVLYPVKDKIESWVDFHGLFPWKFRKQLNELTYHIDETRIYDQVNHLVWWEDVKSNVIPPQAKGMISCFFYFRALDLKVGEDQKFWVNSGAKNYELMVKVHRKERIKVKAGEFDCLVVEPVIKHEGLFDTRGKVLVWVTDDFRHTPVKVKGKLKVVGSLNFELVEAEFAN